MAPGLGGYPLGDDLPEPAPLVMRGSEDLPALRAARTVEEDAIARMDDADLMRGVRYAAIAKPLWLTVTGVSGAFLLYFLVHTAWMLLYWGPSMVVFNPLTASIMALLGTVVAQSILLMRADRERSGMAQAIVRERGRTRALVAGPDIALSKHDDADIRAQVEAELAELADSLRNA